MLRSTNFILQRRRCCCCLSHSFLSLPPTPLCGLEHSPRVKLATRARTVCKPALFSFGASAIHILSAEAMANAKTGAAERTIFHLDTRQLTISRTSVLKASSARTKRMSVRIYYSLEVIANLIGMASTLSLKCTAIINAKSTSDQCEGPPNFKDLADTTGRGLNVNGSVCLNSKCTCVIRLHVK